MIFPCTENYPYIPVSSQSGSQRSAEVYLTTTTYVHSLSYGQIIMAKHAKACLFAVKEKWSTQRRTNQAKGEHANSTQKGPSWDSNLEPCSCEAVSPRLMLAQDGELLQRWHYMNFGLSWNSSNYT